MLSLNGKKYYTIREVAQHFKVAPSLIRFWEQTFGGLLQPYKNQKGSRRYRSEDIAQFGYIYHLVKEKGYSLAGARKVIEQHSGMCSTTPAEVVEKLHALRSFLVQFKKKIPLT